MAGYGDMQDDDDTLDSDDSPASLADPRAALKDYLMKKAGPDPYAAIRAKSQGAEDMQARNAMLAGLSNSAAMMGSIGGHQVVPGNTGALADSLYKAQMGGVGTDLAIQKQQAAKEALYSSLMNKQSTLDERSRHNHAMEDSATARLDNKPSSMKKIIPGAEDDNGNLLAQDETGQLVPMQLPKGFKSKKDKDMEASSSEESPRADKMFEKLSHDLNGGLASSRSDYGKNQATVTSAKKIMALGEQGGSQEGGLDQRQIHELAIASANLVGGGTGAAQSTVDALVPHTFGANAAGIEEWLSSNPQGTNQQAFVKRMLETAGREKYVAEENIKGIKMDALQTSPLKDLAPGRWQSLYDYHVGNAQTDDRGHYVSQPFRQNQPPGPKNTAGMALGASSQPTARQVAKKEYSKSRNQTRVTYTDGSQEVLDGQQ